MSYGNRYTAGIDDDRDRLQELKGTFAHWAQMCRKYAEETKDPYSFVQYVNLQHMLEGGKEAVEHTINLVLEEKAADIPERFSRLHQDICRSTAFGTPC